MYDPTESSRRAMQAEINTASEVPEGLTTEQLTEQYEVLGFMAPYVAVKRKSDGVRGTMQFRHSPRVYFGFEAER